MKRIKFIISILILFLLIFSVGNTQNITLFKNSSSNYHIVIPSKASPIEKKTANILKYYLDYSSGYSFKIVVDKVAESSYEIIIGNNTTRSIGNKVEILHKITNQDGFIIKAFNNNLVFIGGKRKGLLYAAYTFLEKYLGYNMLSGGNLYKTKLQTFNISKNLYDIENPSFNFRTTNFPCSGNDITGTTSEDSLYCDWNKLNYLREGWHLFAHTFANLLPQDKYFKTHPEYYALVNGNRTSNQPCLSNPMVLKLVVQELRKEMQEYPEIRNWSVSYNDNFDLCTCDLCKKKMASLGNGNFTDLLVDFVNKICDSFPNQTISTLAYMGTQFPPNHIKKLRPNFAITFCATNIDRANSIAYILQNKIDPGNGTQYFLDNYNSWKNLLYNKNNILLWDYVVNYSYPLSPYPNLFYYQPNLQYFKAIGIKDIFEQGYGDFYGSLSDLKCYLLSKLMWNANYNEDSLIENFCEKFYGPAGNNIIQYIHYTDNCFKQSKATYLVFNQAPGIFAPGGNGGYNYLGNGYLSPTYFNYVYSLFSDAFNKVKNNAIFTERIKNEKLGIDYTYLEIAKGKGKSNNWKDLKQKEIIDQKLNEFNMNIQKSSALSHQASLSSFVSNYFN